MTDRDVEPVLITGLAVTSACGRGTDPLLEHVAGGASAFGPVTRFDASGYRARLAAELPGGPGLDDELVGVVHDACAQARISRAERAACRLLLAIGCSAAVARMPPQERVRSGADVTASTLARRCGLGGATRVYSSACVAASTAVADAAAAISLGRAQRVVVAAGYLVDEYHFALFDAGRALAADGALRAFSAHRKGMLLGDGVAAVVLESATEARRRRVPPLARLSGWGRAGDAHHVSQPDPAGKGLARAVGAALRRAGRQPTDIGYINAHGTGTLHSDRAESAALQLAFGPVGQCIPVSSSKSVHGHALEASGLLELAVTVLALRSGRLPVNAGFLEADDDCRLNLVTAPQRRDLSYAMSVNCAFGGANTALVVGAA